MKSQILTLQAQVQEQQALISALSSAAFGAVAGKGAALVATFPGPGLAQQAQAQGQQALTSTLSSSAFDAGAGQRAASVATEFFCVGDMEGYVEAVVVCQLPEPPEAPSESGDNSGFGADYLADLSGLDARIGGFQPLAQVNIRQSDSGSSNCCMYEATCGVDLDGENLSAC